MWIRSAREVNPGDPRQILYLLQLVPVKCKREAARLRIMLEVHAARAIEEEKRLRKLFQFQDQIEAAGGPFADLDKINTVMAKAKDDVVHSYDFAFMNGVVSARAAYGIFSSNEYCDADSRQLDIDRLCSSGLQKIMVKHAGMFMSRDTL